MTRTILAAALLAGCATMPAAEEMSCLGQLRPEACAEMHQQSATMLAWIASETSYEVPAERLQVGFADAAERRRICLEGGGQCVLAAPDAIYSPHTETVWLSDDWDAASLRDRALAVHELVHWMQDRAGMRIHYDPCVSDAEPEAWALTKRYVEQHGEAFADFFDPAQVAWVTTCRTWVLPE